MARYLFVVPPFAGHVFPAVSIAQELASRGHDIAWVTTPGIRDWLPAGARIYEASIEVSKVMADDLRKRTAASWLIGLKVFWEEVIVPLSSAMLPSVEAAIDDFQPTVVVVDQQALAGALAARKAGIPWVTSSTSGQLHSHILDEYPKVQNWVRGLLATLQIEAGVEPVEWPDRSPNLILLYTTRALIGEATQLPPNSLLIGPATSHRPESGSFEWDRAGQGHRLLVSLGSIYTRAGSRLLNAVTGAFGDTDMQVLMIAPSDLLSVTPPNFVVRPWVPQIQVLQQVDAVLTHAGTTVNEALSFGLPVVVAPITQDQPILAQEVVNAGAGLRVRSTRVSAQELRRTVLEAIENPAYKAVAQRIQASFREAGGAKTAANAIEALA